MLQLNEIDIINMYTIENKSTKFIAEYYQTYPNRINRILKKHGIELKDRSLAQKIAISSGRLKHPTQGTTRPEDVKNKISKASHDRWKNISDEQKKKISDLAKKQWEEMSDEERDEFRKAAARGVRKAASEGSKIEKFLLDKLRRDGYNIIFHTKQLMAGTELELDFYLPELKTIIEIDGPAHFFPIWGEEVLQKKIRADAQKGGLILSQGMVLIRVKYLCKNTSDYISNELLNKLENILQNIEKKFPDQGKRLIELEVNV